MFYFLFAATVAYLSYKFMFEKHLMNAYECGIENAFTENMDISKLVFALFAVILAPVFFVILVVPKYREIFTIDVDKVVNQD